MDTNVKTILLECTRRSDESSMTFPQVVKKLLDAGVEQYRADLVRSEKVYYLPSGVSLVVPCYTVPATAPQGFSADAVSAAVKAIQLGKINYAEFCRQIVAAGCVSYVVSLAGKRAIYSGRKGDCYVEPFPQAA